MGARSGLSQRIVDGLLGRIEYGTIDVTWPDGSKHRYGHPGSGPSATLVVSDARAIRQALTGGGVGFAEGYMHGSWDTPDLMTLLDVANENLSRLDRRTSPTLRKPLHRARHALRSNSPRRSRKNIEYHYDLGNEFYELWLDDSLTYSCALFGDEGESKGADAAIGADEVLCDAQRSKWDRLLELLQPGAKDRLLEIGCGWGGFAMHAAKEAGCRVTGITLSQEQHDYALDRVREAGLEGQVEIKIQDYRHVDERYTGVASIEMFEAVGEKYWPTFFGAVHDLLEPGKRAAIQTITICEESFERYRANPDFIQRYIFPGGMLPSPERFSGVASEQGLRVHDPHFFGQSYARTLEMWLERFDEVRDEVVAMGFDERFIRMWRYYLAYCRTGFRSGNIDVMQVALDT